MLFLNNWRNIAFLPLTTAQMFYLSHVTHLITPNQQEPQMND